MNPAKTLIIDIDGVILEHYGNLSKQITIAPTILPGVIDKFNDWNAKGYYIILMTGRKESMRRETEITLNNFGVFFDQLVMGVTNGQRVIINDLKSNSNEPTAIAITPERNKGMSEICL